VKIAVVGAGVAGLSAAHALQRWADVTLFEAQNRLGGHTDTHAILAGGRTYPVDSGFMAWDAARSPGFGAWLDELGVASQPTDLSLGVHVVGSGLEYGTGSLAALIGRPRKACSMDFLGLLRELLRFYLGSSTRAVDDRPLGVYLDAQGFSQRFRTLHVLPVCRALWSLDASEALALPANAAIPQLMRQRLLPAAQRPEWRVIQSGAGSYVDAFVKRFSGRIRVGEAVRSIARPPGQVILTTAAGRQAFDAVVIACHSHEALALLEDASREERQILGTLRFRRSVRVLHSDVRVMPGDRRVWSAWNARVGAGAPDDCEVSFWMNRLLALAGDTQLFVTLDPTQPLDHVWSTLEYAVPILDDRARGAQRRREEISGVRGTWYCGAWWGDGLQEDGFASGADVARALEACAHGLRAAQAS